MEDLINIVQGIVKINGNELPRLLSSFEEHQSFSLKQPHELESVVTEISDLLNSPQTRLQGILLLATFLPQCSLEVLEQKGILWMTLCTKICNQKDLTTVLPLTFTVLIQLLKKSIDVPEISKFVSNNGLPRIIDSLEGLPLSSKYAALECVEKCLQHYAGPCGPQRNAIEKFVLNFVDSTSSSPVQLAGKCLHLLQQTRGGGHHGISHKGAWSQHQNQLIGSLHELLDKIYAKTMETFDGTVPKDRLNVPDLELSSKPIERATQLTKRFNNLCRFLRAAIIEPFPVAKTIQPTKLMGLINRILDVNCRTLSKNLITDNIAIGALLPEMHIQALDILEALIYVLRGNMLLYSKEVCQLFQQCLIWTFAGQSKGHKKPYTKLRTKIYNLITLWCKTAGNGCSIESIGDLLVDEIIQDVTPYQNEVTLKVLSGGKKYMSKKARQRLLKVQNEQSNLAQTHSTAFNPHNTKIICSDEGNEILCIAAHNCLTQVLLSCGAFLKPIIHKTLHENLIPIGFNSTQYEPTKPNGNNMYGASPQCRYALHQTLESLVISPHHLCPPPLQYVMHIASIARCMDSSQKVRDCCAQTLRTIEKVLHPQKEVLFFPTDMNAVTDVLNEEREQISVESSDEEEDVLIDLTQQQPDWRVTQLDTMQETDNEGTAVIEILDDQCEPDVEIIEKQQIESSSPQHMTSFPIHDTEELEAPIDNIGNSDDVMAAPTSKIVILSNKTISAPTMVPNGEDNNMPEAKRPRLDDHITEHSKESNEEIDDDAMIAQLTYSFVPDLNALL